MSAPSRTTRILNLAADDETSERWGDLIEWLCDPEGTHSFMTDEQRSAPLTTALLECSEEELTELRLAAEICPVHHVDAAICADDFGGSGVEDCRDPAADEAEEGHK